MTRRFSLLVLLCVLWAGPTAARAGMATPIPENPEKVYRLNNSPLLRLQTISFFAVCFFLCGVVVQVIWNFLRRDFPTLPRLSLPRALGAVFLWGLLFVIVLTMISGARELMTPGAWKKQGFVYKLVDDTAAPDEPSPEIVRRQGMERLRAALWQFAAAHRGRFPSRTDVPAEVWEIPDAYGTRYVYVAGLTADEPTALLAYEPELLPSPRVVLLTNGEISTADSSEIRDWLKKGHKP